MKTLRTLPLCVLASVLLCSSALTAQQFAPKLRIVDRVDDRTMITLKGKSYRLRERGLDVAPAAQAPSLRDST